MMDTNNYAAEVEIERCIEPFFTKDLFDELHLKSIICTNMMEVLERREYEQLQTEFASMKSKYVELHSKQEFLSQVFEAEDLDSLRKQVVLNRNDQITEKIKEFNESKALCADAENQIAKYVEHICQRKPILSELIDGKALQEKQAQNAKLKEILEEKRAELKKKKADNRIKRERVEFQLGTSISSCSEAEQLHARQTESIKHLNAKKTLLEECLFDTERRVCDAQEKALQCETKLREISNDVLLNENSRELGRLESIHNWYSKMNGIAQVLSGFKVLNVQQSPNQVCVRILDKCSATITFGSKDIKSVSLDPDLIQVNPGLLQTDLQSLLIELRDRVSKQASSS